MKRVCGYERSVFTGAIERKLRSPALIAEDQGSASRAIAAYRAGAVGFSACFIGQANARLGCATTIAFDRRAAEPPEVEFLSVAET